MRVNHLKMAQSLEILSLSWLQTIIFWDMYLRQKLIILPLTFALRKPLTLEENRFEQ
jgi:hypothetical protein